MPDAKPATVRVRPFWSGTITFGLVSIPVDLVAAVQPRQMSMKLVDEQGHPLGRRYYCPKDDKLLDNDDLVRGYETGSGRMVVITDEEFESAAPEKSRDIELKRFVPADAIPPAFYERPYLLAPDERAGKAYALLAHTMAASGKAGIGSFVMRGHEYLVAILSGNGMLRAEVLRYANELRTPEAIGMAKRAKPDAKLVRRLGEEIEALARDDLDLSEMEDMEADTLRKLARRKAKSRKGVIAMEALENPDDDTEAGAEVIDLMQVLRRSLGAKAAPARTSKGSRAAKATLAKEAATRKTAPGKSPAGKASAKRAAVNKTAAKKTTARKAAARTAAARTVSTAKAAMKSASARKVPATRTAARKTQTRNAAA